MINVIKGYIYIFDILQISMSAWDQKFYKDLLHSGGLVQVGFIRSYWLTKIEFICHQCFKRFHILDSSSSIYSTILALLYSFLILDLCINKLYFIVGLCLQESVLQRIMGDSLSQSPVWKKMNLQCFYSPSLYHRMKPM